MDKTQQQIAMEQIDQEAKKGKRKWFLIMFAIIAAVIGIAVGVCLIWGLECAPYALIFGIVGTAIAGKLCMAQVGKLLTRQRTEREKLDTGGKFSRFDL